MRQQEFRARLLEDGGAPVTSVHALQAHCRSHAQRLAEARWYAHPRLLREFAHPVEEVPWELVSIGHLLRWHGRRRGRRLVLASAGLLRSWLRGRGRNRTRGARRHHVPLG